MLLTMFWKWEKYYTCFTLSVCGRLISKFRFARDKVRRTFF